MSVQSLSCVWLSATPWTTAHQPSLSSLTLRVCSYSCPMNWWCHPPLSWWCYPTISSSVIPFSSFLQPFQTAGSVQMSQLFISGGQNTGVSALTSVLPKNTKDWFPLGWTGWITLQLDLQGTLKSLLQHHSSKASILRCSPFFIIQIHIHTWPLEKP